MHISLSRHFVLLVLLLAAGSSHGQTTAPDRDPQPELDRPQVEKQPADTKAKTDEEKLDAFFDDLKLAMQGNDDRAIAIKKLKSELKAEYADLEPQLADAPFDPAILKRLSTIAQYYQNLSTRSKSQDPRRMHEVMQLISDRTRQFRRENPELARKKEFRERESKLRSQAMRMNRFVGGAHQSSQSLRETMRSLSPNNTVIDRWAPKRLRAHPGEAEGAIQTAHFTLRRLVRLRWDGNMLVLSKEHWRAAFAGYSPSDVQADVNHLLEQRGIEPFGSQDEEQRFMRLAQQGTGGPDSHIANLGRLFHEFYEGGGRSYSSSGNSGRWSTQASHAAITMEASPTDFSLSFAELQHPRRLLRIQAKSKTTLSIILLGDFIHRFQQHVDASGNMHVQVTEILDDEVLNYRANTFAELYRQHPRYVEARFIPLLEHLGIVPPHSRFDVAVSERVVELLAGNRPEVRKKFEEIAKNLDVDKFTLRESAFKQLQDQLDEYLPLLFEKIQDQSLSREARARIDKLIEIGNQKGTAELDAMIGSLGLTNNKEYLQELADTVDERSRQVLRTQIDQLSKLPYDK